MKRHLKQSWQIIRQNPILSIIGIIGTAFAICMVMVLVQQEYMKIGSFPPESNRYHWLVTQSNTLSSKDSTRKITINSGIGEYQVFQIFRKLKTPEAVTAFAKGEGITFYVDEREDIERNITTCYTDEAFWQVFDFTFLAGKNYTEVDLRSDNNVAIITDKLAKKFFGSVDEAVGREAIINGRRHRICGVVRSVTPFCYFAYADIWQPVAKLYKQREGLFSNYKVICLAKRPKDFDKIHDEIQALTAKCNTVLKEYNISFPGQPNTQFVASHKENFVDETQAYKFQIKIILLLALFLCIPAINLSGMTLSRMRRRLPELGVRRSFGAVRTDIIRQVLSENMLISLIGGVLGLILSYIVMAMFPSWLLQVGAYETMQGDINTAMFNPIIILIALLFCILINLLSAFIPAWRISKTAIVESLSH